ncbi:MAG: hypothetical protein V2A54_17765 [Bacteroidota bacterium]
MNTILKSENILLKEMNNEILIDNVLSMLIKEKNDSINMLLFDDNDVVGNLFYKKNNDNLAGLSIFSETWVIERAGSPFSMLRVRNIKDDFFSLRITLDGSFGSSVIKIQDNLSMRFVNTCFWRNTWAWVNTATNESLIEFEMKPSINKRGMAKICLPILSDEKASFLCMIGWYILHNIDVTERKKADVQDALNA